MRREKSSINWAIPLVLSLLAFGSRSAIQAQDQGIARIERAMAELREECHQLGAQLEEAKRNGNERKATEITAELKRNADQIREYDLKLKERMTSRTDRADEHPEIAAARRQVEHLRAAHEHLKEGGFLDLAVMVGNQAEEIQQAIHRHEAQRKEQSDRERPEADRGVGAEKMELIVRELNGAIRQLREDVKQLREEVGGLRERSEGKDNSKR